MTGSGLTLPMRQRRFIAVLSIALAAGGCANAKKKAKDPKADDSAVLEALASDEVPAVPAKPVVIGGLGGARDPAGAYATIDANSRRSVGEDDAFFAEKFDTANREATAGADDSALDLIAAALRLNPKSPWDARFRALRSSVKARHLEVDVLRADARGARDFVAFDTDVDFIVRLRNVGTDDLVIKRPVGAGRLNEAEVSGAALVLQITRHDRDIYGAELSRTWSRVIPLIGASETEVRIAPESVHEIRVRLPAEDAGQAVSGLRTLDVSGDVRMSGVTAGIAEPVNRVPIRTGRVVVLPGNFEPIAADPLGSLDKALKTTSPIHVLLAAEFIAPGDRPQAVRRMADALMTGPEEMRPTISSALALFREENGAGPLAPLAAPLIAALDANPSKVVEIGAALHALTQVSLAPEVGLWQEWWRRGAPPPKENPSVHKPSR